LRAVCDVVPAAALAGHYHDTHARALDNIRASLEHGLRTFDASVAGLGGCPYAPGSKGNVATEDVVEMLHGLGYDTGLSRAALSTAASFARSLTEPS
jgi:hydroxymethylglutaryl-CoA lyase